jgi:hypothetical protein
MTSNETAIITIDTRFGSKRVTAIRAAQHAARQAATKAEIRSRFSITGAPRGVVGYITRLAGLIYDLRSAQRRAVSTKPLTERLRAYKCQLALSAIKKHRVCTPTGMYSGELASEVTDDQGSAWIVHVSGWFEYSRRAGSYYIAASYLAARDGNRVTAQRVPSTITQVDVAREWIKPAEIRYAEGKRLPVKRQGSMYFRPQQLSTHDFSAMDGTRHDIRTRADGGRTIVHPEYPPVVLGPKHTWRAYPQKSITGGR